MHKELEDKCALCGNFIGDRANNTESLIIEEIIQNTPYKFDTRDCAMMFKRLLSVYGVEFQPFLGDRQYISDPFWDRVVPKEHEIKELEQKEEKMADQKKGSNQEVVSLIKDSFQVQKLINQLIGSAREDIALAIPGTAADIFFYPQEQASSSVSCSMFFQRTKDMAAANRQLNVKIITNAQPRKGTDEEKNYDPDILIDMKQGDLPNIQVKYIEQDYSSLKENMVILIADRKESLAIELEDEERGEGAASSSSSHRMIKLATHSANRSTVLSYVSIFETLWKEIEVNEKVIGLLEEIKKRENIERDFINVAAHELRAPIQPVLGLAQILQSKKNVDTKEHDELLSVIIRNASRLNILTKNLLDLTKIESNTLTLQKEIFNLSEIIFDALTDIKSQLSSNQITVNVSPNNFDSTSSFLVWADKTRIAQVVSNLLSNAISFTKGGTIEVCLENKNIDMSKQEVIVSFKDSGRGIDPEIMNKLFEKFVTTSGKSTGLGLFICRNIVEAHGGRIWAMNNPEGKGATFSFSLPKSIDQ